MLESTDRTRGKLQSAQELKPEQNLLITHSPYRVDIPTVYWIWNGL